MTTRTQSVNTFHPGDNVWLQMAGENCEIRELIGSGGQGQVYHTAINDQDCAMKWYFPHSATAQQRAALERLIHKGPPNDRFLWPLDIVTCEGNPGFGYLMPLRQARFRSMAELMSREVDPTFRTLTNLGLELADSFLRLHSLGLCYSDISFGNIFFDPETGEVSICDNDNIAVDGEGFSDVLGTPRFMAPEIVREEARPNINTDLYSLAVILFYIFMVHHPLEGRREREIACMDLAAMKKLYGTDALFIFDPKHGANRPVPGVHNNATLFWNLYPGYVREIFTRAFTEGLRDPAARVRESEWRAVFTRMRDQIYYCINCGAENFLADEGDQAAPLAAQSCWFCHEQPVPPMRLLVARHSIVLNQDTLLFPHHLDPNRRNDYSEVHAEMVKHPTKADVWGLKNVSGQTWTTVPPSGGSVVEVATGKSVSLIPGLRIRFGASEGTIL
jgi:DNA-binding helix-hairpin-helix protein with protein kinase domain